MDIATGAGLAFGLVVLYTMIAMGGDLKIKSTAGKGSRFVLTPTQAGLNQAIKTAMEDATDVVRRRIDALGTREPTIVRQGDNRILAPRGIFMAGGLAVVQGPKRAVIVKKVDAKTLSKVGINDLLRGV